MKTIAAASLLILISAHIAGADAFTPQSFTYKTVDQVELKLTVLPAANAAAGELRPAIVFFHGGGWVGGTPNQFKEQSRYLASRGLICIQAQYRLLKKESNDPPLVCVQDAKSAMRWVRAHAKELNIDPARIAAGGGSAGGHLAAFVGMVEGLDDPADDLKISPRPAALVLFNPVFNNGPGEWGNGRVKERYKEFSPAHNISADDPPALVMLGSIDKLLPVKTVEAFKTEMEKLGVRCEVRVYKGQGHSFFNYKPTNLYYYETLIESDKFLTSLGWLKGPPTLEIPDAVIKAANK